MSRSRSYQRSRHLRWDSNQRPCQSVEQQLATFEDAAGNLIEDLEADPAFPGKCLVYYLSPRTLTELHQDPRLGCRSGWELERTLFTGPTTFPIYAHA